MAQQAKWSCGERHRFYVDRPIVDAASFNRAHRRDGLMGLDERLSLRPRLNDRICPIVLKNSEANSAWRISGNNDSMETNQLKH